MKEAEGKPEAEAMDETEESAARVKVDGKAGDEPDVEPSLQIPKVKIFCVESNSGQEVDFTLEGDQIPAGKFSFLPVSCLLPVSFLPSCISISFLPVTFLPSCIFPSFFPSSFICYFLPFFSPFL